MTITLTQKENLELWDEAAAMSTYNVASEDFEFICEVPKLFGSGYARFIDVYPELSLEIRDIEYHDDLIIKFPTSNHPVQFGGLVSGVITDSCGYYGEGYTFISGAGVQKKMTWKVPKFQRIVAVDIHMPPELLATFFPGKDGETSPELKLLVKGDDWQTLIYPKTTNTIQGVLQQIANCPLQGITKQIYLQGKVLELMALQLSPILANDSKLESAPQLHASTIAKIHYAKEILLSRLENPPSLLELAQQVKLSERTLQKGFQSLFGITVLSYVIDKRMERAEHLLREGNRTVTEVAMISGYSNISHFSAAFKRKFSITPKECLLGKMTVSRY
ncbi:transcriptional regulator [Rivularia sp. IAM M-261]|nr:transcriptional regulator [Calothrix sp. PCC 7716]GJD15227.1 transcriptional regulator [Rivularia sp. IAM M-261]